MITPQPEPWSHFSNGRLEHGIAMLGPPGSGKTTFLGALSIAFTERGDEWKVAPADEASAEALYRLTTKLTVDFAFPLATEPAIESYHWQLVGQIVPPRQHRRRGKGRQEESISIDLRVSDSTGVITRLQPGDALHDELIQTLGSCRGIVLLFDPVSGLEPGGAFEDIFRVLSSLPAQIIDPAKSADARPPHYVAVCVSKFDEARVLAMVEKLDLPESGPDERNGFPRVGDSNAREVFAHLCDASQSGSADQILETLENYFQPDHVRYFITSAIGFYVDPRTGAFNPQDHFNYLVPDQRKPREIQIRGPIHPVNVAEPLLWLGWKLAGDSQEGTRPGRA